MGKTIDDLTTLDDTPLAPDLATDRDPRPTNWYRFIGDIDDLLATGQYTWAEESLRGIQETVGRTKRVTDGQRLAVDHIERAGERRRGSRRYEGWRR